MAGFSPIRVMMASLFLATLTTVSTITIHGSTAIPLGWKDRIDSSILTNTTFITISRHMEPYIRHQPEKMSEVPRLPPTPKASGAVIVSTARMKYLSAISKNSLQV